MLRRFTSDVDAVQDAVVEGLFPVASAAVSGPAAPVVTVSPRTSTGLVDVDGVLLVEDGRVRPVERAPDA